jgi:hypothetical protein
MPKQSSYRQSQSGARRRKSAAPRRRKSAALGRRTRRGRRAIQSGG